MRREGREEIFRVDRKTECMIRELWIERNHDCSLFTTVVILIYSWYGRVIVPMDLFNSFN